jgi:hypothetical protein
MSLLPLLPVKTAALRVLPVLRQQELLRIPVLPVQSAARAARAPYLMPVELPAATLLSSLIVLILMRSV